MPAGEASVSARDTVPDGPSRARLRRLAGLLESLAAHHRHVSYQQAEADVARLAAALRRALPARELAAASYRAIPRGGLVVFGMLAYELGLSPRQLDGDGGGPLVLVDDCALSGLRLAEELDRLERGAPAGRPLVAAHLYSPRQLRRAVERSEPRVSFCVAAHDLADLTPRLFPRGDQRHEWRRRWRERLAAQGDLRRRYWLGVPEPVSFAWSEPDHPFWNRETGCIEAGWRFVPPHRCLKHRSRLASSRPAAEPEAASHEAGWRLAGGVVWGEFDDVVWLCRRTDLEVFSLAGSAAVAWRSLVTGGGEEGAAARLATEYAVDRQEAAASVAALVGELSSAGLLVSADGGPGHG